MGLNLEQCVLGIEFGSTRIKGVLIDEQHHPIASGSYAWENRIENGVFVYHLDDVKEGLRTCYAGVRKEVEEKYGVTLTKVQAIGISGMMHGYLVFDKDGKQIAPYRTWRNTITAEASAELMELFKFNIPQRWSIAHLYQAILNKEEHVKDIAMIMTLASYVHYMLTGERVIGVDEASGMFPYDDDIKDFDAARVAQFDELVAKYSFPWKLKEILPKVLPAGAPAGTLTREGAALLDETGALQPGIPMCPPEGDAGTGMVATGAVTERTGSISAGTSSFSLQVLEKPLKGYYPEIDVVATPSGKPVAMAHCNNCTPDIDVWVKLMAQSMEAMGFEPDMNALYQKLFDLALEGEPDCGGMVSFNYFAGEPLTGTQAGRPMFLRLPDSRVTLANFMRTHLYGAIATLKLGIDFLAEKEQVETDRMLGHGGYFKTPGVGQQILADALETPISVMETAGEGGPWGMALLAAYMIRKEEGETLEDYLANKVFAGAKSSTLAPDPAGVEGFKTYIRRYQEALDAQKASVKMV